MGFDWISVTFDAKNAIDRHGETLAQKPETPAYYDIVNRHSKINEEVSNSTVLNFT